MSLETIVQIVTIAAFIAAAFSFAVLRPLNTTISRLERTVEMLASQIERADERRHELEIKVAATDQRAKSAHKRLDAFAEFCHRTHNELPTSVMRSPRKDDDDD